MLFDFDQIASMKRYELLLGTVVPRPIALISFTSAERHRKRRSLYLVHRDEPRSGRRRMQCTAPSFRPLEGHRHQYSGYGRVRHQSRFCNANTVRRTMMSAKGPKADSPNVLMIICSRQKRALSAEDSPHSKRSSCVCWLIQCRPKCHNRTLTHLSALVRHPQGASRAVSLHNQRIRVELPAGC